MTAETLPLPALRRLFGADGTIEVLAAENERLTARVEKLEGLLERAEAYVMEATRASSKLRTMYQRLEVSPRAELERLMECETPMREWRRELTALADALERSATREELLSDATRVEEAAKLIAQRVRRQDEVTDEDRATARLILFGA